LGLETTGNKRAKRGWMSFIINLLGTIEIEESKIYLNPNPNGTGL